MDNAIEMGNESDYRRAIDIEAEIILETGYKAPPRERLITYPASELADAVRSRLNEEGIAYK